MYTSFLLRHLNRKSTSVSCNGLLPLELQLLFGVLIFGVP